MKAWKVFDKERYCNTVIIFSDSRAKAIYNAMEFSDEFEDCQWVDMRARRFKEYDQYYSGKSVIDFWMDDEHRINLVKNFDWHCQEPDFYCKDCPAIKWCYWHKNELGE